MTRYFLYGKEISEQEANEIVARNREYIKSGNFELMMKCEFVTAIEC